jgi:hypothetical protein
MQFIVAPAGNRKPDRGNASKVRKSLDQADDKFSITVFRRLESGECARRKKLPAEFKFPSPWDRPEGTTGLDAAVAARENDE